MPVRNITENKQEKIKRGDMKRLEIFIEMITGETIKKCENIEEMIDKLEGIVEKEGSKLSGESLYVAKQRIYEAQIE